MAETYQLIHYKQLFIRPYILQSARSLDVVNSIKNQFLHVRFPVSFDSRNDAEIAAYVFNHADQEHREPLY